MVLALTIAAAPAKGDFRYVAPPAEAAAAAWPGTGATAAGSGTRPPDAPPEAGEPAADTGRTVWRVHEGEMLRAVLARWGARAGADVLFLTDRRYRLDGAASFEGGFADAVQALFRALAHLPHPPAAARAESGTTLVVTHRSRSRPQGGNP